MKKARNRKVSENEKASVSTTASATVTASALQQDSSVLNPFDINSVVKIVMANDDMVNVEIEEIDENDCGLQTTSINTQYVRSKMEKFANIDCDSSDEDEDSPDAIAARLKRGCECTNYCFKELDPEDVYRHRLNIAELTKTEHDMYLMGVTMGCMGGSKITSHRKDRQRHRSAYVYRGKRVCLEAFLFLENVTLYHIKRIRNHVLTQGVTPRVHGNAGRRAHNAFSLEVYKNIEDYLKKFLKKYVTDFNKAQTIQRLNRSDVYNAYKDHGRKEDEKLMGYSTFRQFMKKQFPMIRFRRQEGAASTSKYLTTNNYSSADTGGGSSSGGDGMIMKKRIRKNSGNQNKLQDKTNTPSSISNEKSEASISNVQKDENTSILSFELINANQINVMTSPISKESSEMKLENIMLK